MSKENFCLPMDIPGDIYSPILDDSHPHYNRKLHIEFMLKNLKSNYRRKHGEIQGRKFFPFLESSGANKQIDKVIMDSITNYEKELKEI